MNLVAACALFTWALSTFMPHREQKTVSTLQNSAPRVCGLLTSVFKGTPKQPEASQPTWSETNPKTANQSEVKNAKVRKPGTSIRPTPQGFTRVVSP